MLLIINYLCSYLIVLARLNDKKVGKNNKIF